MTLIRRMQATNCIAAVYDITKVDTFKAALEYVQGAFRGDEHQHLLWPTTLLL